MLALVLFSLLITAVAIGIVVFLGNRKNTQVSDNPKNIVQTKSQKDDRFSNYITPTEFRVGLLEQDKPLFMNNCNEKVLYPINGLGPEYGWKMPSCRCTEFVQPP